jgi:hypothetical protein
MAWLPALHRRATRLSFAPFQYPGGADCLMKGILYQLKYGLQGAITDARVFVKEKAKQTFFPY